MEEKNRRRVFSWYASKNISQLETDVLLSSSPKNIIGSLHLIMPVNVPIVLIDHIWIPCNSFGIFNRITKQCIFNQKVPRKLKKKLKYKYIKQ